MNSAQHSSETAVPETHSGIASASFVGYLVMIFLTAVNDNMFRWLIIPIAKAKLRTGSLTPSEVESQESLMLSLGLGSLVLPFVLFAPYSGWVADRFSKRSSTILLKIAEVFLVGVGVWSIHFGHLPTMFAVLFLLGTQSALLSTAKFGIIPELVARTSLSAANGLVALTTLVAVIAGTVAGNELAERMISSPDFGLTIPAIALLTVAVLGVAGSWLIQRVRPADPGLAFPVNPITWAWRDLKLVFLDRPILRVTLGITFFWSLASLAQMNIDTFVTRELLLSQTRVGLFLAVLSVGVGLGSLLAGWWSNGRVELGMVPLGALTMAFACVCLFFSRSSSVMSAVMLATIGVGGGLFNVPLNAWLQERSPHGKLGAILAAGNQLTAIGMVVVAGLFWLMRGPLQLSAAQIFLVCGMGILPILYYVVWLLPQATVRFVVWLLSRFVYRVRCYDIENVPEQGGALLVANHVSWLDGVLLLLASSRNIRMVAYADYIQGPWIKWLANLFGIIPIRAGDGPRALMQSLNTARDALIAGELVCIFAEGQITRTGQLQKFERGLVKILKGTDAPVIPVYLDELWGSVFSYERGRFFWKKPSHWPYPVSISFGSPVHRVEDVDIVRHAVLDLGTKSLERRKERMMIPAMQFIRQCRLGWNRIKAADSAGAELTGGRLLTGSLAFHKLLTTSVLKPDVTMVGLLLPPSSGGLLANAAVALSGKVAVNLNYTLSDDVVNYCIREAGVKQVLTSRRFLEKKPMNLDAELIYLEDLKEQISGMEKALAFLTARLMPFRMLCRKLGLDRIKPDDLMSVIFTSGSTGEPKGVMLSQNNIGSNLAAVRQLLNLKTTDMLLGVLPFFHSFGFTISMWLPLCTDPGVIYHFNPLDSRTVGKLIEKYKATILLATPTFLRSYMKRCSTEELKSLNLVIVGAEKLPDDLRDAFREKYGFEPSEGYGTTELSPVASVNIPASRLGTEYSGQTSTKHGTVGRVIPGSVAAVFHTETNERLGTNQEGMLKIKGPNVMLGYLNHPEKSAELIQDGWYTTGDLALIDDEGFIRITGRQSRFSKIGGEMVPHLRIEAELTRIMDDDPSDEPGILCAVTAVPDASKGERLIVLHKPVKKSIRQVTDELKAAGLPNLWIPSQDSFLEVEQVPLLGTGKLDLRGVKDLALKHFG
ncbi:MAG: MFS transporter [Planctomycetaceae bacterium]|nr:MFS transporter [Planctomycetaceae bacterium]